MESDEELKEFIAYLKEKINEDVGEILAEVEQPEEVVPEENEETQTAEGQEEAPVTEVVKKTVKTTDVVNIRSSDSETADKLDKAQIGQEFELLEEKGNGWSKVNYNGKEAYIKSDYLEVVSEEVVEAPAQEENQAPANVETDGTVKVIENVKIRKSASTDSDALATAYVGQELELVMKQADGWTKIKYNGQIAYVKSEYVE